jgi:hypothetical protein
MWSVSDSSSARLAAREVRAKERLLELGELGVQAQRGTLAGALALFRHRFHHAHVLL